MLVAVVVVAYIWFGIPGTRKCSRVACTKKKKKQERKKKKKRKSPLTLRALYFAWHLILPSNIFLDQFFSLFIVILRREFILLGNVRTCLVVWQYFSLNLRTRITMIKINARNL